MDLVYKEDVVLVQVGKQGGQVPRLLDGWAGGDAHVHPHLIGDDAAEGGLAQSRGAVEQHMVQGLMAHLGRLNEHLQVALGLLLADVLPQGPGPQGVLPLVLPGEGGGHQGLLQPLRFKFCVGKINGHRSTSCSLVRSRPHAPHRSGQVVQQVAFGIFPIGPLRELHAEAVEKDLRRLGADDL